MRSEGQLRTLARVVRPQGRHGEVLCDLFTDFPHQFTSSPRLLLTSAAGVQTPTTVERFWLPTGRSAGRVVLKLAGTDSITQAELLRGSAVEMPQEERLSLEDGTYYVSDLLGCEVHNAGAVLGTVVDVQFPVSSSGKRLDDAAAIFAVTGPDGQELLVPFAQTFVLAMDLERRLISMALPPGLTDLNG